MKEIIERAINNGWVRKSFRLQAAYLNITSAESKDYPIIVHKENPNTLNDLLADKSFVKALFGEEAQCMSICPINCDSESGDCITKIECKTLPVYIQHCRRLSTIFDQQKKIDYIKRNMR